MTDPGTKETFGLVVRSPGMGVRVERLLVEPPGRGEVRVRSLASGICHTDLLVARGRDWWRDYPYVLGHEGAGVVESVGPGVDPSRVGRLVSLAWKAPCDKCRSCTRGRAWMCLDPERAGQRIRLADGALVTPSLRVGSHAGLVVVPARAAIDLPRVIDPLQACLLGCAVLTGVGAVVNTARVTNGDSVAVFGCGGVGLSIIAGARLAGADPIIAVDPQRAKLEVALTLGATHTIESEATQAIGPALGATAGRGIDHAFDAVGRGDVLSAAMSSLATGGVLTLVGTPEVSDTLSVPLEPLYLRRIGLRVSQYGDVIPARDIMMLAKHLRQGALDLAPLVSRVIELQDAVDAMDALADGSVIRVVIAFQGQDGAGDDSGGGDRRRRIRPQDLAGQHDG